MRTKVTNIWLWGCAAIAVAAVVMWVCRTEYGKGYSEDQRRNWNEMIASLNEFPHEYENIGNGSGLADSLRKRQSSSDAPQWSLELSSSLRDLPIEGRTIPELKQLAKQGNGDACLELCFRSFESVYPSCYAARGEFFFPSPQIVYMLDTYLKRAMELGRPGSGVLLRLFESRKRGKEFLIKDDEEYAHFLSLLDEGDFFLGKLYVYLDPEGGDLLDRLDSGLRKRAELGDAAALRNAGHLALLRTSRGKLSLAWYGNLSRLLMNNSSEWTVKVRSWRDQLASIWPEMSEELDQAEEFITKKIEVHEKNKLWRKMDESLDLLWRSAEQGDLHAKFLWCQYTVFSNQSFTKEKWERCFRYFNEVIGAGGVYAGCLLDPHSSSIFFEDLFYERCSVEQVVESVRARRGREYAELMGITDDDPALLSMEIEFADDMDMSAGILFMRMNLGKDGGEWATKGRRAHAARLIEGAAREGDPSAMFYLVMLLEEGTILKEDPERIMDLLVKLNDWCSRTLKDDGGYFHLNVRLKNGRFLGEIGFKQAIDWQILDFISRRGAMPGMTEQEAFNRFISNFYNNRFDRKEDYFPDQLQILKEQFEKRGFKVPDAKK